MRRRRHQHERAGKPLRSQKLGKDRANRMAEKHGARRDRLEEGLKLGAVIVHANADKSFCGIVRPRAVDDEIGRVASPAQALEHRPEFVEAPGSLIGPVQHDDVLVMTWEMAEAQGFQGDSRPPCTPYVRAFVL